MGRPQVKVISTDSKPTTSFHPRIARIADCTASWSAAVTRPMRLACAASTVAILVGRITDGMDRPPNRGSESGTSCGHARFSAAVIITTQIRPVDSSCAGRETMRAGRRWRAGRSA